MLSKSPHLSIVAVSRNDDHGGTLLVRMQHFIDCLSEQVNISQVPVELILVEWNPPKDRPSLERALSLPGPSQYFIVRIITVPYEVHKKFQNSDKLAIFQMIGKNVGIRRARGQFILATNIDILFSNELIEYISSRQLEPGKFYRVNRVDCESNIPAKVPVGKKLEYCRTHIIRTNGKYYLLTGSNLTALFKDILRSPGLIGYYMKNFINKTKIPRLHYNACGDFTLMAKEHWHTLRGYPELEMFSLHIDSLFLICASYSGLNEEVLRSPKEIYHIEHSIGSGITPGIGQKILFQKLDRDHIQYLSWRDVVNLAQLFRSQIHSGEKVIHYNQESWGLEDIQLNENVPLPASNSL
jgi:hypothetical protein